MNQLTFVQELVIWAIPVLFAITLHEYAHGWVAMRLGDKTAYMLGRVTLNPFAHIDPLGTVILPVVCLALGNFIFGWAKPVPVDWRNLKKPRRDAALVAIGGPIANLLMAIGWTIVAKISLVLHQSGSPNAIFFIYMGHAGIVINLVLMVLNLIPIPPLDGSRVVSSLLPPKWAFVYGRIEPYGFFILIGLLVLGVLPFLLGKPVAILQASLLAFFNM